MDYIEVVDQEIYAYHGVLQEEKKQGQYFYISFKAFLDTEEAAREDRMDLSVSYADMCQTVKTAVTAEIYDLIETVADKAAKALLLTYPLVKRVVLKVKKPSAPVGEPVEYPAVTVERGWHQTYIAVGSNQGRSIEAIQGALALLREDPYSEVTAEAPIIETKPWGKVNQPNFYNSAIGYKTLLSPKQLMKKLLEIEAHFGRVRKEKWGPRTLDLDLILYDDLITVDDFVTLPHPLMEERAFVLEPLCAIAPNVVHPLLGKRLFRLLQDLDMKG